MNILILGGNSPRHKQWVRDLQAALAPFAEDSMFLDYRHWDDQQEITIQHEASQASKLAEQFPDQYIIVAKSIGTVVATLAISQRKLHPMRCVFLGFPLNIMKDYPFMPSSLVTLPPATVLQNEQDPLGSFDAVKAYLSGHCNTDTSVQSAPGNTHDYVNFDLITRLVRR